MNDLFERNNIQAWRLEREWYDQSHEAEPELPLIWRAVVWIAERVARIWGRA